MNAKIIFDYHFNPENRTGFCLQKIPNELECSLYKNFQKDFPLANIILKKERDFVFAEFDIKEEWYELYPILGYNITDKFERGISFDFFGTCALTNQGINPNTKVKSIRQQLIEQEVLVD